MSNSGEFGTQPKVAIVSGGSFGIGAGCVSVFVRNGVNVVFFSNRPDEGRQLERRLNEEGPGVATFVLADCRDETAVKSVVSACESLHGRLDWVVNNVGSHPDHAPPESFGLDDLRRLMEMNVFSAYSLTLASLRLLRRSRGCVVNICSLVARIGQRHAVTYVTTKAALAGFTKALAVDEAEHGVRVNSVSPGNILTPLLRDNASTRADACGGTVDDQLESYADQALLGRLGTPEEVGTACLYLCRDATFCTGVDLPVTGGAELDYGRKFGGQRSG